MKAPFPRVTYDEAAKILTGKGLPFEYGGDLGGTDETVLSEQFDRPVCVTHYPAAVKAFYMKPDPAAAGQGAVRGRARARGLRRDHRRRPAHRRLRPAASQRIKEHGLPHEAFEWYLDLRRYGSVPHGGFGMGIERVVVLDLRPRARAGDDSVSPDAVPPVPLGYRLQAPGCRPLLP